MVIVTFTLINICRVVGYDESNSNRLKKDLLKLKLTINMQYVFIQWAIKLPYQLIQ